MLSRGPKNIIAGFLLLAVVAGSSALVLSGDLFGGGANSPDAENSPSAAPAPKSAFRESLPGQAVLSGPNVPTAEKPLTITDELAKLVAEKLIEKNPHGPYSEKIGGTLGADIPDLKTYDAAASELAARPEIAARVRAAANDVLPIPEPNILENPTPEDLERYARAANDALKDNILDDRLAAVLENQPTAEALNAVDGALGRAENQLSGLAVPKPLRDFHVAALKAVVHTRSLERLLDPSASDPIQNILAYEARQEAAAAAIAEFETEAKRLSAEHAGAGAAGASRVAGLIRSFFGIKTAHAIFLGNLGGPAWIAMSGILFLTSLGSGKKLKQDIKEFVQRIKLELIKDVLVHRIVQQVILWIQGGGKPQFITNWKRFLGGAASEAVGIAAAQQFPTLCSSFGPLVAVALQPINTTVQKPVLCTLGQIVGNVRAFANNFENGGWIAYGAALQPSNNFFGALIQMHDITKREMAADASARKNDAEASEGWLSTRVCVKYEMVAPGPCQPGAPCDNVRQCTDWETTTPGQFLGKTIYDALGAPIQRIVNSQDVAALVSVILNALVQKLLTKARGLSGAPTVVGPGLAEVAPPSTCPPLFPPDFSGCYSISDAPQRKTCIDEICRDTCWTAPPCSQPPGPNTPWPKPTTCGNGVKDGEAYNENCATCPEDYGACRGPANQSVCGDGICYQGGQFGPRETHAGGGGTVRCPQDCPSCQEPPGVCDGNDTCRNCPEDCGSCNTCENIGGTVCLNPGSAWPSCSAIGAGLHPSLGPTDDCTVDCCGPVP